MESVAPPEKAEPMNVFRLRPALSGALLNSCLPCASLTIRPLVLDVKTAVARYEIETDPDLPG